MSELRTPEQFAIGEIAIMCNPEFHPENDGRECTVIGGLQPRTGRQTDRTELAYRVQRDDGAIFMCRPYQLRKKRPPRKDLEVVRWADCPWQPESIHV
jgi:hypothetical protein